MFLSEVWRTGAAAALVLPLLLLCPVSFVTKAKAASSGDEVQATVFHGGQFSPEEARVLARAKTWLDGLELAAQSLAVVDAVRLAGLDLTQRQALAAQLAMVEVAAPPVPAASAETSAARVHRPEGEFSAVATVGEVKKAEVSRLLADTESRERYEELIVMLRRLVPEALEWAERGHDLRAQALGWTGGPPADELVASRLSLLSSEVEACLRYMEYLGDARKASPEWERTLSWADDLLIPLRLERAEMLLRQDRPQAARLALSELQAPPAEATPEMTAWARARSSDWSAVWGDVWGPHPSDLRLYVRGLRLRALAQLRSGQAAVAEEDLDAALALAPDEPDLLLARGAVRQVRENFGGMCEDYYRACALGRCEGLAAARERDRCLPEAVKK